MLCWSCRPYYHHRSPSTVRVSEKSDRRWSLMEPGGRWWKWTKEPSNISRLCCRAGLGLERCRLIHRLTCHAYSDVATKKTSRSDIFHHYQLPSSFCSQSHGHSSLTLQETFQIEITKSYGMNVRFLEGGARKVWYLLSCCLFLLCIVNRHGAGSSKIR